MRTADDYIQLVSRRWVLKDSSDAVGAAMPRTLLEEW